MSARALVAVPSAITVASFALRCAFLLGYLHPAWGLLGTALDALDGWTARRLQCVTPFGAELDWHGDVACAALGCAALARELPAPLAVVVCGCLLPLWAFAKVDGKRVSGAAAVVLAVAALRTWGPS